MSKEQKKAGGVFAIEDEELKWRMMKQNSEGRKCEDLDSFMKQVFATDMSGVYDKDRYVACFMPATYKFDLENKEGAASPMDAAQAYVDFLVEGFSVFVWDRATRLYYCNEADEHIYKSLIEADERIYKDMLPAHVMQYMSDEDLSELRKLIDAKLPSRWTPHAKKKPAKKKPAKKKPAKKKPAKKKPAKKKPAKKRSR